MEILLERGELDTVLLILKTIEAGPRELRELDARPGKPSLLWEACDLEHLELVNYVMNTYGSSIRDDPAPGKPFSRVVRFHVSYTNFLSFAKLLN